MKAKKIMMVLYLKDLNSMIDLEVYSVKTVSRTVLASAPRIKYKKALRI
jgi:hypothetical protein